MRKFLVIIMIGIAVCIWGYGIINNIINELKVDEPVDRSYVVVEIDKQIQE